MEKNVKNVLTSGYITDLSQSPTLTKSLSLPNRMPQFRPPDMAEKRGSLVVFFPGLSDFDETAIARELSARFESFGYRVTPLENDDLGLYPLPDSEPSRSTDEVNLRCITAIASEVLRHGGVAICLLMTRKGTVGKEAVKKRWARIGQNTAASDSELSVACERDDERESFRVHINRDEVSSCQKKEKSMQLFSRLLQAMKHRRASLNDVARETGVERHVVERLVRSFTGKSFRELQREVLLARSAGLLRRGKSIKEVAFDVGFGSPQAFHRFVRRASGRTPTALGRME